MNKKLSSTVFSVVVIAAILGVANYIVGGLGFLNLRADLTDKSIYTLSSGTKKTLEQLPDVPIKITFYATKDSRLMPQFIQNYTSVVQDLLLEFEKASNGKITLEKVDPRPNTEEEDQAIADDIQGHVVNNEGDKAYLGLAIQSLDKKEIIAALNPQNEAALEYQVARTLAKVTQTKRPLVGVMSPMPIATPSMQMPNMSSNQPPPWVVMQQLRQDYDLREIPFTTEAIDKDINLLLIIHPSDVSDITEYAIDQFLLRGGKVIAYVDPEAMVSPAYNRPGQLGVGPTTQINKSSSLKRLFKHWGVGFDPALVVADMTYRTNRGGRAQPTMITIDKDGINQDEPITASLDMLQMLAAGAFNVDQVKDLKSTILVESSDNSNLITVEDAEKSRNAALNTFVSGGKKLPLAVRLNGRFTTAFPEGKPSLPDQPGAEKKTSEEKKPDENHLSKAQEEGVVILVGDADMAYDVFAFESDPSSGQLVPVYRNSNVPLLLNSVELLTGGNNLIEVRSRGVTRRPFTRMEKLLSQVEEKYRPLIEEKNSELNRIVQEIAELGGVQQQSGQILLNVNQEQRRTLLEKQSSIQKEIRNIQKDQNRNKERVEMILTSMNLFAVPSLVIVFGLIMAARRRTSQAAK